MLEQGEEVEGDDGMMELLYPADEMMEVEEEEGWLRGRRRLNSNSEEEQLPFRAIQAKPDFHRPYLRVAASYKMLRRRRREGGPLVSSSTSRTTCRSTGTSSWPTRSTVVTATGGSKKMARQQAQGGAGVSPARPGCCPGSWKFHLNSN